ncbi:PREDICTED: diacylglycerol kinase theta [Mandrillus leucophaeus]|uniref:diacylglycerol kinase theta n=1 Tax=Mandrillus leucophaeus TaxID=9568 RepID=UPI0005F407CA|nr:PREDICTED: diacylglycerol kinase theta [Mandrillus leucophaeus]
MWTCSGIVLAWATSQHQHSRSTQAPGSVAGPGHSFRKVTLTKPTFCHLCSDFIWGLAGFLCDVCNFMSHEKCLKLVRIPCTSVAPSLVRVPVAHCFGPRGLHKRKFCAVCRKVLEAPALHCEVCELHLHPDCVPFACSDCRQCHQDGHQDHDTHHHHWREGNLPSGARCEVCRKTCGSSDVLAGVRCEEAALRVHHIPEDPGHLELCPLPPSLKACDTWPGGKAGSAVISEEGRSPGSGEATPEAWVIRALPRAQEVLKIYPGWLKVGVAYVSVRVTPKSTARSVVLEVLPLLGRQAEGPESFQLVEVAMGCRQVQRTALMDEQPLLDRLQDIRQMSVRQVSQTRFYVAESRDVAPHVSLFVGGLPPGLSPEEYSSLLHEAVATKATVVSVSHVYSSQGAVVLDVTCFSEAERLYVLLKDMAVRGRLLTALVLPDLLHAKLPPDSCPLLVFVNPKSGGLKGRDLLCSFRKLLNPHQVFDLTHGGPLPGLHLFSQVPCFRVLVCGGDGTVGWVLGALEETRYRLACPEPSVAILPLGTGNDLGRVLRWGAGYSGEDPLSVLLSVDEADAVLMDRWTILLDAHDAASAENGTADAEPPKIVQMSNYCGIGIDAELSLDFHQAREEEPGKFTSRLHNKGVYVRVGLQKISHSRSLHKQIRLQVERQEVELPSIEGLIFINIPSWGSGADLWGSDSDARFEKPRMDDGLLEVVGVTGVVHMGQVQGGLRSGIRIAQGSYFRVTLLKATPVQVDGEPWVQAPGHMIISAAGPKVHMLRKAKQKPKRAGTTRDARADAPAPEGDAR